MVDDIDAGYSVSDLDHIKGPTDAPVTIIEYGDFQCPNCKQAAPVVALLLERFERVRFVFRHFPLEEVHAHALIAAEAAEAASRQRRFWEMHDVLFAHQPHFQSPHLRELARGLGCDVHQFAAELKDHVHVGRIREDKERGRLSGVRATPAFYVNGQYCDVSFGLERLERAVVKTLS